MRKLGAFPAREAALFAFLVALVIGASIREPRFLAPGNIDSILLWLPLITVAAMGEFLVIVTRGIDISIGSILGFTGIAVGEVCRSHPAVPVPLLLAFGLAVGALLGFVNGGLVWWGKLAPVIVTIATLAAFRGGAFLLSGGEEIDPSMIPDSLTGLARTGLPLGPVTVNWLLLIALAVAVVTAFFVRYTRAGRNIFAFGSNPTAAPLRGISSRAVNLTVYVFCGATAGLAGVMYAGRYGFVNPASAGRNFELNVIAAAAIGGVKITGGSGSVLGVLLGCLLLSCINVALAVLGIDADWQMLTYGVVILAALCSDALYRQVGSWRAIKALTTGNLKP